MNHPLGFCPQCGPFPATAIGLGGGQFTFVECGTNCPMCGGSAEIVSGTYELLGDRLQLLLHPSVSPETRAALAAIARRAQAGEINPQQAQEQAEKVAPGSGKLFDVANWSDQAKATLYAAVIGAGAIIAAARMAAPPSQTVNVQPVIERVIDKSELLSSSSLNPRLPRPRPAERR